MCVVNYTELRNDLAESLNLVNNDKEMVGV